MDLTRQNKRKIINDPVYGLIGISDDLIFDIIEHPYFQRLRRIKQLGEAEYALKLEGLKTTKCAWENQKLI